jgi:hypothetical protein
MVAQAHKLLAIITTTNTTKHTPNTITIQSISKMTITTTTMSIIATKTTTIMPTINAICNFHI